MSQDHKVLCCLTAGCGKIASSRGLCYLHYNQLVRQIKKGETTMAAEEVAGRVRNKKQPRYGRSSGLFASDHDKVS